VIFTLRINEQGVFIYGKKKRAPASVAFQLGRRSQKPWIPPDALDYNTT